jgi:hypothetical protein
MDRVSFILHYAYCGVNMSRPIFVIFDHPFTFEQLDKINNDGN